MSATDLDVLVVGGGITGLSVVRALDADPVPLRVALVEASQRLGGNIATVYESGFLIDAGPDSFVAQKPEGRALCEAVGLGGDLITPEESARKVYLRTSDGLRSMPDGMVLGLPTSLGALARSDFLGPLAKVRLGLDLVLPRGDGGEETIAQFIGRRFGEGAVLAIAEPLLAGIHSGRADELSIQANFPQLVELEERHRSVLRGLRATAAKGRGSGRGTAFWSLRRGMGSLIDAMATRLPAGAARVGLAAIRVERHAVATDVRGAGYRVTLSDGSTIVARAVVLCVRSHVAAPLVENIAPDLADAIASIDFVSSAVVFLGYDRDRARHPLDAFGFVSQPGRGRVAAATFVSSKLAGRAPVGKVLLRAFLGGARDREVLREPDGALVSAAKAELGSLLGLGGEPIFSRVFRYDRATPQLRLGHRTRVARLRVLEEAEGGLFVAGGGYEGVGVPECIRQGFVVAVKVREFLSR